MKFRVWSFFYKRWITHMCLVSADGTILTHSIETDTERTFLNHHIYLAESLEPSLMRSTGILDNSGNEIYEGDIVLNKFGDTRIIHYKFNRFEMMPTHSNLAESDGTWYYEVDIIGNIYETPELIII